MEFDLLLLHAPSVYDFRVRDDVLFAYLSNSDSVHVSPIFEMPPVGVFAIKQHLGRAGFEVEFFNVASKMRRDPSFDVEEFFRRAPARYVGIDLHWLAHAHGALELARIYKELHPSAKVILGGIASTYYHEELIDYPQVDYVMRGYDTLAPLEAMLQAGGEAGALSRVPNLTWKSGGETHVNEMTYVPQTYSAAVNWKEIFHGGRNGMMPYNIVIPQAGCEYSCTWCGGSRYFFRKYMGLKKRVQKDPELLKLELKSIAEAKTGTHTVTMIDFWHETPSLFNAAEDIFVDENIDCVHFSLHRLPTVEKGRKMGGAVKAVIELSPDSHDMVVAKAAGRGAYTMQQMEDFIDALIDDIYSFEIYFLIGLPRQTVASVWETVDYCEHLLEKYQGRSVTPYLCPMLPFLDPGSEIYDNPEKFGYRIFHRTVEEHRRALLSMNWKHRLNFETEHMTRDMLVDISYQAVRALTLLKRKYSVLPAGITRWIVERIDHTQALLKEIEAYQAMPDGAPKAAAEREIKRRILEYNREQLRDVHSQQRPTDLGFVKQQWFDTDEAFERVMRSTS
jgi:clorobiocin/coumermycin A biosynthesis protein CloN6/CouN6